MGGVGRWGGAGRFEGLIVVLYVVQTACVRVHRQVKSDMFWRQCSYSESLHTGFGKLQQHLKRKWSQKSTTPTNRGKQKTEINHAN